MSTLLAGLPLDASVWCAGVSLIAAALLMVLDRGRHGPWYALGPLALLAPLAAAVAWSTHASPAWAALAVVLVAAALARSGEDAFHTECSLKLLWVMGGSLALSWAAMELLVLCTGTSQVQEQWGVLRLGLDPPQLWSAALSLSLVAGVVLLGGAPFHFWAADVFQGSRAWLAPLSVAALQISGAGWLVHRLAGIGQFPEGARLTSSMLGIAATTAFVAGAATLLWQRRPERRVGTLASLHGALLVACLALQRGGQFRAISIEETLGTWAPHLALALTGAATLSRFVPVSGTGIAPAAVLFRRHPVSGVIGLFSLASLAGLPGTPGARVWLDVARALAEAGRMGLLLSLAAAWLASFAVVVRQAREAFGIPAATPAPEQAVPWLARAALWSAGVGLVALGFFWLGA